MEKYRCSGNSIDLSTAGAFPLTTLIAAFTNLFGTPFVMLSTGLNGFINAQGFPRVGMMTTVIGAILNLILDPLFIFSFHMGVSGAALATVISQIVWQYGC